MRIVVLGYLVRGPIGGLAWHYMQYVLGLIALGHDVIYLELSDDYVSCYDAERDESGTDPTYGLVFAADVFARAGLGDRWAFHDTRTGRWHGPRALELVALAASADLCVNVSGMNLLPPFLESVPVRAFVDTDPAFTQIRHLTNPDAMQRAAQHNAFFTFAGNLAAGHSTIPNDGFPWRFTRQPIVLDAWPQCPPQPDGRYTSVLLWESYSALEYQGRRYGPKSDAFEPYFGLPERAGSILELALGSPSAPGPYLESRGWTIVNPLSMTRSPWTYQQYIQRSKGEFAIAKHGYVASRSGWFSERTACYLATGRPAIVQDTGFATWLPSGDGILSFSTPDAALAALDDVNSRYEYHCRAAREIAETYFDARKVLADFVESAMAAPSAPMNAAVVQ